MTNRYRWSHPQEWLQDYIKERSEDANELFSLASELAQHLDGDQIQDLFQSDMDADGYFDALTPPPRETIEQRRQGTAQLFADAAADHAAEMRRNASADSADTPKEES